MRSATLLALLLAAPGIEAVAQQSAMQPGQRVRVTAPTLGLVQRQGTVAALHGDSALVVSIEGQTRVLPLSAVTSLQVKGHRHHPVRGMGIGAAVGAVGGALAGYGLGEEDCSACYNCWACFTREQSAGAGALGGAVAGGLIGLVAGAFITTDHWTDVSLDRMRVTVVPRRDGPGLGASIAF